MSDLVLTGAGGLAIPDHIKALARVEGYAADVGEITRQDIGLNFLNLVHGMSAQAKPNWDNAGAAPLQVGTMILTRDRKIVPPGTAIIPLLRKVKYVKFKVDPTTGKDTKTILAMTDRRDDPRIVAENGLSWRETPEGKKLPPLWRTIVNFWVISPLNQSEAAVLGFSKTALKVAQALTRELVRLTCCWKLPLYAFRFKLGEPSWPKEGENSWPRFTITFDGYTKAEALPKVKQAYENAIALYAATSELTENYVQVNEAAGDSADTGATTAEEMGADAAANLPLVAGETVETAPQALAQQLQEELRTREAQAKTQKTTQHPPAAKPAQLPIPVPQQHAEDLLWGD